MVVGEQDDDDDREDEDQRQEPRSAPQRLITHQFQLVSVPVALQCRREYRRRPRRFTDDVLCSIKKVTAHSIIERSVPELILILGSQPAGDMSHKPGGRLPLLSARPAVTLATLNPISLLGEQRKVAHARLPSVGFRSSRFLAVSRQVT